MGLSHIYTYQMENWNFMSPIVQIELLLTHILTVELIILLPKAKGASNLYAISSTPIIGIEHFDKPSFV